MRWGDNYLSYIWVFLPLFGCVRNVPCDPFTVKVTVGGCQSLQRKTSFMAVSDRVPALFGRPHHFHIDLLCTA